MNSQGKVSKMCKAYGHRTTGDQKSLHKFLAQVNFKMPRKLQILNQ